MGGIRRAFVLHAAERQITLLLNLTTVALVSRLLTPAEIGVSAIGLGIMMLIMSAREFATAEFLIQRREVSRADVRTSFTVLLALNAAILAAVQILAPWLADFYGEPNLAAYLRVVAMAGLLDACSAPISALLRREMAYGALSTIGVATAVVSAATTLILAVAGFSYMSFAWAWLAASAVTASLSLGFRPDWWMFRPSFGAWRTALTFGGYNGAVTVLSRFYEALPQLVLGRVLTSAAVGHYNRASAVTGIPDRIVLASVFSVALPAFAAEARKGRSLKDAYLNALAYITVAMWPALALLAWLADPVVDVVLGSQWLEVIPLVRIMSSAALFWFPVILTYPVLIAVGATRDNFVSKAISIAVCSAVLVGASFFGVLAMALAHFVTGPFQGYVALRFVRRHVPFAYRELAGALWKSAVVTLCSLAGPAIVTALAGFRFDLSIGEAVAAGAIGAVGWVGAIWLTAHPFQIELRRAVQAVAARAAVLRRRAPARERI